MLTDNPSDFRTLTTPVKSGVRVALLSPPDQVLLQNSWLVESRCTDRWQDF